MIIATIDLCDAHVDAVGDCENTDAIYITINGRTFKLNVEHSRYDEVCCTMLRIEANCETTKLQQAPPVEPYAKPSLPPSIDALIENIKPKPWIDELIYAAIKSRT